MLPFFSASSLEILAFAGHGFVGSKKTHQVCISRALGDDHIVFNFSLAIYVQIDTHPTVERPQPTSVPRGFRAQGGMRTKSTTCASKINLPPKGYNSFSLTLPHPI